MRNGSSVAGPRLSEGRQGYVTVAVCQMQMSACLAMLQYLTSDAVVEGHGSRQL